MSYDEKRENICNCVVLDAGHRYLDCPGNAAGSIAGSAYSMRLQADFEANFRLLTEAERLEEVADSPVLRAKLYVELSNYYLGITAYDQAKSYADRNLKAAVESGVSLAQAYGHTSLATYYNFLDVGDVAVHHAQRALQILRSENDCQGNGRRQGEPHRTR